MADHPIRRERLGPLREPVEELIGDLLERNAPRRLREADHTLWSEDPTEIADRLGWLAVPAEMLEVGDELDELRRDALADGFTDVLVMGMGGSSLFPEVLARSTDHGRDRADHGDGHDRLRLSVLDSTDPEAVGRALANAVGGHTLLITSSKSGTTIETRSHLEFMWDRIARPEAFVAITDPGSELAELARDRNFRAVFENRPDIGGRYSALSHFGLVPAALADPSWRDLVGRAIDLLDAASGDEHDPAVRLGAILAAAVREGRDKVTFLVAPEQATFGLWLEQLLAESTGKNGTGVVPIVGENPGPVDVYGDDRLFVAIGDVDHPVGLDVFADAGHPVVELDLADTADLGAQVVLWEMATALAGAALDVNPFDQPNVAEAKAATNAVLEGDLAASETDTVPLEDLLGSIRPGDHLVIQAYLDPESEEVARLEEVRLALRARHRIATSIGIGPRFLHSTGQLHKGGPPTGVFLQIVGSGPVDLPIPGRDFGFGQLLHAQADGDLATLRAHDLRVTRTTTAALEQLVSADPPTTAPTR